ncbi:MAG: glycine zipper 2TM domain-containing protein [Gammaproteobacteria bacterium]|jgi:uncharacterized protein YcfJ|nr:glycine zipper 2TM domain-containing protein [Gammaproteobacteria bacterium]
MNKSMLVGSIIGAIAVTALGSVAGYKYLDQEPQYAEVVSSKAVIETYSEPVEQCKDVIVQQKKAVKDDNQIAGTVLGAVVGGVLGNQIGGGSGKKVATVAAAAAGGYAGKQVQQDMQNKDIESRSQRECKTVQLQKERTVGFDVRYLLNGELKTIRMDKKPAEKILIKDGQVIAASL